MVAFDSFADVRPVEDADSASLIALIGGIWSTYPGIILDVDAEEPWMRAPESAYREKGGAFWVVGRPVSACIGVRPMSAGAVELKSLYVSAQLRRRGIGEQLVELVERWARDKGAERVVLWSDSRFETAHHFYARRGYERTGRERSLADLSHTTEWEFAKEL